MVIIIAMRCAIFAILVFLGKKKCIRISKPLAFVLTCGQLLVRSMLSHATAGIQEDLVRQ
jgi:hypothetical protein